MNQSLLDLHKGADGDAHLCDFLEANFLDEQVEAIKEMSGWITKLKRVGPGLGFHMIDKEIGNWTLQTCFSLYKITINFRIIVSSIHFQDKSNWTVDIRQINCV